MADKKLLLLAFVALLLSACTADPQTESLAEGAQEPVSSKIINSPASAIEGMLIINLDDSAIEMVENTASKATQTRSVATRSGIGALDNVLNKLEVTKLERLFPVDIRNEERTRAAGLHKWYVVEFAAEVDLTNAAQQLARVGEVQTIQFDVKFKKSGDYKASALGSSTSVMAAATGSFNDEHLSKQWHYINTGNKSIAQTARVGADINVADAWKLTAGDPSVVVAVVDEGVKHSHPDLIDNMWVNLAEKNGVPGVDDDGNGFIDDIYGLNFVTNGTISWDRDVADKGDSGHGTHVAGTVAAVNNNGMGVCGVAGGSGKNDGVKIMSCQIFSGKAAGSGSGAVTARAIKYAADNGASIIQCSFGFDSGAITSDAAYERNGGGVEFAAIQYFIGTKNCKAVDGGVTIFAAGNDGKGISGYPGGHNKFISVTAFGPDYLPAYYTNYGPGCNIAAPGGEYFLSADKKSSSVLSTMPAEINGGDHYGYMQGTSMACPHVSGIAALGLSYALAEGKTFTLAQFNAILLTSVNDIDRFLDGTKVSQTTLNLSDYRKKMGTGAIDAYQVLMQIEGTPCLKATVGTEKLISLNSFFGNASANLTYLKVEMTAEAKTQLGITEDPTIAYGKLKIKSTKPGVAKIKITAIAGGGNVGGGAAIGGTPITREFAIIARSTTNTNGGWL